MLNNHSDGTLEWGGIDQKWCVGAEVWEKHKERDHRLNPEELGEIRCMINAVSWG